MGLLDTNSRENTRITLGLLEAVEAGRARTQRGLAADLGIALGLVNVYLKRCVKKGLVKVAEAPARRYAYYLTPQGFAEKTRLTAEYLSWSLTFFRQAKEACGGVLERAEAQGWRRVALIGQGDLADIARICAADRGLEIVAIVDASSSSGSLPGGASLPGLAAIADSIDGAVVTDLGDGLATYEAAAAILGRQRVLTPSIVPVRAQSSNEVPE